MVSAVGIEPTTFGLEGHCSSTELCGLADIIYFFRKKQNFLAKFFQNTKNFQKENARKRLKYPKWWRGVESNYRHKAFQASALPLSYPAEVQ